jgi:hypothetical protein
MNYYDARQRQSDGKWDYSVMNDGHVHPAGYCSTWPVKNCEKNETVVWLPKEEWDKHRKEIFAKQEKYHDHGHATHEEACECYRQYLLDSSLRFHEPEKELDTQYKCEICGAWTQCYAIVEMSQWNLCKEHLNRESVEKLFGPIGSIMSS